MTPFKAVATIFIAAIMTIAGIFVAYDYVLRSDTMTLGQKVTSIGSVLIFFVSAIMISRNVSDYRDDNEGDYD